VRSGSRPDHGDAVPERNAEIEVYCGPEQKSCREDGEGYLDRLDQGFLYQRGAFTAYDTVMTNRALFGYGTGLIFYALSMSFVRIFNAMHDMKTPAIIGLTSIALNASSLNLYDFQL